MGVLFVLMSLCHGVITANAAGHDAMNGWETTYAHSKEIPTPLVECAADTKALVSLDRRLDSIEGDQLAPAFAAFPERREQIQYKHISPPSALPHDLQALLQVFRI